MHAQTPKIALRKTTPESRQFHRDEANRVKHVKGARREFRALLPQLQPLAEKAVQAFPDRDQQSLKRRGRLFSKDAKNTPEMVAYLDEWIGTEAQHPKAYSWRTTIIYQARDVLLYKKTQRDALAAVEKQAFKGFEALTMAEAQAPFRDAVPAALREYLPTNIVVEVDENQTIQKVTDRFENEHITLGVKIQKMKKLVRDYNKIAKRVKKDFKSPNEIIKMSAVITAIIMETGIRPGKAGNGKVVTSNGEELFVETFGAITLGPKHVRFVRDNFAKLEFVGKMTSVNTAEISDASIIKVLNEFVEKALQKGTKFVFVTSDGKPFSYSNLKYYFRANFGDLTPSDFRKLKATETVLLALRAEQAALYDRIRGFAKGTKEDLRERIVAAIVDTFEAAISKSQEALSHDKASTTVKAYINPEVILRFLSTGRVDDNLEAAILGGESKLSFNPQVFIDAATGKTASFTGFEAMSKAKKTRLQKELDMRRVAALGDLLVDLRSDLEEAGIRKTAQAINRMANRWVQAAGTARDITQHLPSFKSAVASFEQAVADGVSRGLEGTHRVVRSWASPALTNILTHGNPLADGILSTRSIPTRQNKPFEMAYRLLDTMRRLPKDIYKWWAKNQKRFQLIIDAAENWPEKQEGSDELFQLGAFKVHNTTGATGAKLKVLKDAISKAERMARTNPVPGFARMLYGDIHLVGRISQAHHAAWYMESDDSLYLNKTRPSSMDMAQSLVHETGHRYWRKGHASRGKKEAWARHHERVDGKDADVVLPEVGDPVAVLKITGVRGDPVVDREDGANFYFKGKSRGREVTYQIERYKLFKLLQRQAKMEQNFPTNYASVSAEEHFCESLKLKAAGKLPPDHLIAFDNIWNS